MLEIAPVQIDVLHGHLLPALYQAQAVQGWSKGMFHVIDSLLAYHLPEHGRLLELGCGGGHFLHHWQQHHPQQTLYGVDLHSEALPQAEYLLERRAHFNQGNILSLPFADAVFAGVVAFDVFDQRGVDTMMALRESHRVLGTNGWLLLRVSAHQWLYGSHDIAFNTAHRFAKQELGDLVESAGFQVQRITYANSFLAGPLILLRLLQRWQWIGLSEATYRSYLTNRLLELTLQREAAFLKTKNLPVGLSLYLLARKCSAHKQMRTK
ncbi:MAG: class I SAM-dependent methyltransferase [Caldilineaceae bacterium]